ncbi:hypothetical protein [Capnocytophaga canis]|uniref:hypothetical protein n=1 Tax=Capnocytophaga canis TaxID=1848903 RepID=UPI001561FD92|nr:hypothetical protein [Capnocytophaga canis]
MVTSDFIIHDRESIPFEDIFLSDENKTALQQLIKEHEHIAELMKYGLQADNKILALLNFL